MSKHKDSFYQDLSKESLNKSFEYFKDVIRPGNIMTLAILKCKICGSTYKVTEAKMVTYNLTPKALTCVCEDFYYNYVYYYERPDTAKLLAAAAELFDIIV